jgi:hypothetical protein
MSSSKLPSCPILDHTNWDLWHTKVQSHLAVLKLKKQLTTTVILTGANASSAAVLEADEQALGFIQIHVSDSVAVHIKSAQTAREAWNLLTNLFDANTQLSKHHIITAFNS